LETTPWFPTNDGSILSSKALSSLASKNSSKSFTGALQTPKVSITSFLSLQTTASASSGLTPSDFVSSTSASALAAVAMVEAGQCSLISFQLVLLRVKIDCSEGKANITFDATLDSPVELICSTSIALAVVLTKPSVAQDLSFFCKAPSSFVLETTPWFPTNDGSILSSKALSSLASKNSSKSFTGALQTPKVSITSFLSLQTTASASSGLTPSDFVSSTSASALAAVAMVEAGQCSLISFQLVLSRVKIDCSEGSSNANAVAVST